MRLFTSRFHNREVRSRPDLVKVASGHRAATAAHGTLGRPWNRARLLAIRKAFREEWQPSEGIQAALIDVLAQAHYAYLHWLERLMSRAMLDAQYEDGDLRRNGKWRLPHVMAVDAQNQAAAMTDRFNRLLMRSLRGLRDLRRHAPRVTIQRAQQVNIGEQTYSGKRKLGRLGHDQVGVVWQAFVPRTRAW